MLELEIKSIKNFVEVQDSLIKALRSERDLLREKNERLENENKKLQDEKSMMFKWWQDAEKKLKEEKVEE